MNNYLDEILDECIDRINRGQDVEACLAAYPDYAEQLEPLLRTMFQTQAVYSFVPSASAKREARQRFNTALDRLEQRRRERQSLFTRVFARPAVWVTAAAVLLLLIGGSFGLRSLFSPAGTGPTQVDPGPTQVTPLPTPEGNFVFLISDDVNAIGDFESVKISISKISLLKSGDSDQLIEFKPEQGEVDLTLVQGDKTQEIWRGNIPEGEYKNVSIEVADVHGILKETGEEVEIKLPPQKLHVSKHFQVSTDKMTTFTYDLTVIAAGSPQSGIKYILKPQVDQSGAEQKPIESKGKGKKEGSNGKKPGAVENS